MRETYERRWPLANVYLLSKKNGPLCALSITGSFQ
jgi:hypothetical protein